MNSTSSGASSERRPWRYWKWGLALGILLRIGAVVATDVFPTVANTWDSNFYQETATALASGEGYRFQGVPTALFPPAYPALLGAAYRWMGNTASTGQTINLLASLWLLAAAGGLARALLGARAARRVILVMALEPSQIIMPVFLMSEVLCAAALATALACLVRFADRRGPAWLLASVGAAVLAGMTRGHAFLIFPAAVLALGVRPGWTTRRMVGALLAFVLVGGAAIGTWTARNDARIGHPVPIATNGGLNLLLGNNPNAFGGRADPPGGMPQTGDEVQDERIARDLALDYVREHPARSLAMIPVKAARLLGPAPALTYRAELGEKWGRWPMLLSLALAQASHLLLWGCALWVGLRVRRQRRSDVRVLVRLAVLVLGVWTLGHLPFLGGARYFFPVQFLLLIAAVAPGAAGGERAEA